ncbi:hypothetical protein Agabi119p4_9710 [Agaricus bisporus var. burnettii]|uniref:Uncharacterized protein n=1 Tax=Agaricus bisporus var. burnettii TaxID=192524 RepID=A0A8H7C463_AGABI|nr:hypothetical protein Agabi119p4_9710 [Agaricus bisporus var. burnettii]
MTTRFDVAYDGGTSRAATKSNGLAYADTGGGMKPRLIQHRASSRASPDHPTPTPIFPNHTTGAPPAARPYSNEGKRRGREGKGTEGKEGSIQPVPPISDPGTSRDIPIRKSHLGCTGKPVIHSPFGSDE